MSDDSMNMHDASGHDDSSHDSSGQDVGGQDPVVIAEGVVLHDRAEFAGGQGAFVGRRALDERADIPVRQRCAGGGHAQRRP